MDTILQSSQPSSSPLVQEIERRMEQLQLSNHSLARIANVDKSKIGRFLKALESEDLEKVDVLTLLKVSMALGLNFSDLVSKTFNRSNSVAKDMQDIKVQGFVYENFDLKALKELGFIDDIKDVNKVVERINTFFQLNSIFEYTAVHDSIGYALYSKVQRISQEQMTAFWMKMTMSQIKEMSNENEFNPDEVVKTTLSFRRLTADTENGFKSALLRLYHQGVTVLVQRYVPKTQVRGATFMIKGKPFIVLTNWGKNYPSLWKTLLHELYHVIYEHDLLNDLRIKVVRGDQKDVFTDHQFSEKLADDFAFKLLLTENQYQFIAPLLEIDNYVTEYAQRIGIDPSIIYYLYCERNKDTKEVYAKFGRHFQIASLADNALKGIINSAIDYTSVKDSVKESTFSLYQQSGDNRVYANTI